MTWQAHRVVWRLRSPLHVGRGKVGNVQMTRPCVIGRVLWGALTERLARDGHDGPATDAALYQKKGESVHDHLAFGYLYPALWDAESDDYTVYWPWDDKPGVSPPLIGEIEGGAAFRARFMSSYASTALVYPRHSAQEGSLHEVEFLSPHTLRDGQPVYLLGVLLADDAAPQGWQAALERLQIGGERGYGWGRLELAACDPLSDSSALFGYELSLEGERPMVTVPAGACLLAHARADGLKASGDVEPLVGRLWGARGAGQKVEYSGICYAPGAVVSAETRFAIGRYGVWQAE